MAIERVVILGAGPAGLAAAHATLRQAPEAEVTVLEASRRTGGLVRTVRHDGFVLDVGPDGFLTRKPAALELCRELGIADRLVPRRSGARRAYLRRGDRLHALPRSMRHFVPLDRADLKATGLLRDTAIQRLFQETEIPAAARGDSYADESVASFFTRRFGREMYETLSEPLAAGIFGGDGDRLSMEAVFPELLRLEAEYGSVLRGLRAEPVRAQPDSGSIETEDIFASFSEGLEVLTDQLTRTLDASPRCTVHLETPVEQVRRGVGPHSWTITTTRGTPYHADAVLCALPAPDAAYTLVNLDDELAALLRTIPYSRAAAVFLGYRAEDVGCREDGSGYVVPRVEGSPALACTWCSRKWPGRAPEHRELFRVFLDARGDHDPVTLARRELTRAMGIEATPILALVRRWPRAIAQYTPGHSDRVRRIDARLDRYPGLVLAGSAFTGVGLPDSIRSGRDGISKLVAQHTRRRREES